MLDAQGDDDAAELAFGRQGQALPDSGHRLVDGIAGDEVSREVAQHMAQKSAPPLRTAARDDASAAGDRALDIAQHEVDLRSVDQRPQAPVVRAGEMADT